MRTTRSKITIYIPSNSYGRFLKEAIESVLVQSYSEWELFLIDDGSSDETAEIVRFYKKQYPQKITVFQHAQAKGLRTCANLALAKATGSYLMRLDADDYLDENALFIMGNYLDEHPDTALVYSNYILINEIGQILGVERRKKIGSESKLLDLPAHGACTLIRKIVLQELNGYDEKYQAQDGHEIWMKLLGRYPLANVSTPLFYYRQHTRSLSRNESKLLASRRSIKEDLVQLKKKMEDLYVVALIPAKNTYAHLPNIVLRPIAGKPLIDYVIEQAMVSGIFKKIFVSTDDQAVVTHCNRKDDLIAFRRPIELSDLHASFNQVLADAVARMVANYQLKPDIVVWLNVKSPLCRAQYIREAVHTLVIYEPDSVISVYEDRNILFSHGEYGLEPINRGMLKKLRLEREALYVDNGAIRCLWKKSVHADDCYGKKIGHVVMPAEESVQIKTTYDWWLTEKIIEAEKKGKGEITWNLSQKSD